jgi:hypothetical protein
MVVRSGECAVETIGTTRPAQIDEHDVAIVAPPRIPADDESLLTICRPWAAGRDEEHRVRMWMTIARRQYDDEKRNAPAMHEISVLVHPIRPAASVAVYSLEMTRRKSEARPTSGRSRFLSR